jgi:hypothetical protein
MREAGKLELSQNHRFRENLSDDEDAAQAKTPVSALSAQTYL